MAILKVLKWEIIDYGTGTGVVISPNALNKHLNTVIVAPIMAELMEYPSRLPVNLDGVDSEICFEFLSCIHIEHISRRRGVLEFALRSTVNQLLAEMFSEV